MAGELPKRVGQLVPRLLMNMSPVVKEAGMLIGQVIDCNATRPRGTGVSSPPLQDGASLASNYRDVPMLGKLEDTIPHLCSMIGLKL